MPWSRRLRLGRRAITYPIMLRRLAGLVGLLLPCAAFAQAPPVRTPPMQTPPMQTPSGQTPSGPTSSMHAPPMQAPLALHASYETYAAGIHVAEVETGFSFGPWDYQMSLGYHTTGMVGFFFRGHQFDRVNGAWQGRQAIPSAFIGQGEWRGVPRLAEIGYHQGKPVVHQLVAETGRCETSVHTYDGRRAVEIEAHTVGEEMLEASSRSSFAGKALRCDFSGRMLSGFKFGDDREHDSKPMHGSAWLAPIVAGGSPLPVRMAFETRWFGDAIMYLTAIGPGSALQVARGN
jgi:hypothetical protein